MWSTVVLCVLPMHFLFSGAKYLVKLDGHYLRIWCNIIWKDTHYARNSCATRRHPQSGWGKQADVGMLSMTDVLRGLV